MQDAGRQVMADARKLDGFAHEFREIQLHVVALAAAVTGFAGFEHLLDGSEEAIGIEEHQIIKLLPLRLVYFAALHRFQIQADGGDRGFQFVRYGVDEAVVLFVAADFADEEDGVENHSGDDRGEKNHAEK